GSPGQAIYCIAHETAERGGSVSDNPAEEWCRACGAVSATSGNCGACAAGLAAPDPGPPRGGHVVKMAGGRRSRYGLAVAESSGSVTVLVGDDAGTAVPTAEFD